MIPQNSLSIHSGFSMKMIPVICGSSGSPILWSKVAGNSLYFILIVLNEYENKYELKAAANESKTKSNVGKGIASPSLVPGAEERGKGVPGVYCWHMCVNSWNTVSLQDISVTLTSASQPIFSRVEDAYYQPCSE